jgi:hypothetical protein
MALALMLVILAPRLLHLTWGVEMLNELMGPDTMFFITLEIGLRLLPSVVGIALLAALLRYTASLFARLACAAEELRSRKLSWWLPGISLFAWAACAATVALNFNWGYASKEEQEAILAAHCLYTCTVLIALALFCRLLLHLRLRMAEVRGANPSPSALA